jgi:small subunit ribosomal protein S17
MPRKILSGVVVNNKNLKTLTVNVAIMKQHPLYRKYYKSTKKYHAHDELGGFNIGDTVRIIETRPYSKTKSWKVLSDELFNKVKGAV